jgi:hypothetical protein
MATIVKDPKIVYVEGLINSRNYQTDVEKLSWDNPEIVRLFKEWQSKQNSASGNLNWERKRFVSLGLQGKLGLVAEDFVKNLVNPDNLKDIKGVEVKKNSEPTQKVDSVKSEDIISSVDSTGDIPSVGTGSDTTIKESVKKEPIVSKNIIAETTETSESVDNTEELESCELVRREVQLMLADLEIYESALKTPGISKAKLHRALRNAKGTSFRLQDALKDFRV